MAYKGYTESGKNASLRYAKKAIRTFRIDVNRNTEPDLLEWLERQSNLAKYLKDLVKKDMYERRP